MARRGGGSRPGLPRAEPGAQAGAAAAAPGVFTCSSSQPQTWPTCKANFLAWALQPSRKTNPNPPSTGGQPCSHVLKTEHKEILKENYLLGEGFCVMGSPSTEDGPLEGLARWAVVPSLPHGC